MLFRSVTDLTRLTIRHMARLAAEQFASSGLGKVILEDWIHAESADWRRYVGDVYHQSGTARMGATPSDGVVDKNCKVFEVANLFVASSAVYPTSSFSNPTMTIIALAIRVTDRVKELLKSA